MPTYKVTDPSTGKSISLTGDSPPTEEELNQVFASVRGPQRSSVGKAWDALAVPEQKSREGLEMLASYVPNPTPTGNLPMDVLRGAPKIAADTLAEAAPGFISRGALVTAGAARAAGEVAPLAKLILRGAGNQAEELSGIAPKAAGSLEAAYKDPTLIFSKGKKAAGQFYEAAKDDLKAAGDTFRATSVSPGGEVTMEKTADIFSGLYEPKEILAKAVQFVQQGGKLEPAEALKARKAVDVLLRSKSAVPDELYRMRGEFDAMAKTGSSVGRGDEIYKRGVQAQALRNVFPQNKYGGASAFKLGIMTALENMGLPGKAAMLAISPVAQGVAATGAGILARQAFGPVVNSPTLAMALSAALARRRGSNDAR